MVLGYGRLSYIISKNGRFLVEKWPISNWVWARGGSNDLYNDVLSVGLIEDCIYNKEKLNFARMSTQKSEIINNFSCQPFFSLWTVKLLFVNFRRFSHTSSSDKICNLSVQPVYTIIKLKIHDQKSFFISHHKSETIRYPAESIP